MHGACSLESGHACCDGIPRVAARCTTRRICASLTPQIRHVGTRRARAARVNGRAAVARALDGGKRAPANNTQTRSRRHATCNTQQATCNTQQATCNKQQATCNTQQATCNTQQTMHRVPSFSTTYRTLIPHLHSLSHSFSGLPSAPARVRLRVPLNRAPHSLLAQLVVATAEAASDRLRSTLDALGTPRAGPAPCCGQRRRLAPHLRRDCPHICDGTYPHRHRDWSRSLRAVLRSSMGL